MLSATFQVIAEVTSFVFETPQECQVAVQLLQGGLKLEAQQGLGPQVSGADVTMVAFVFLHVFHGVFKNCVECSSLVGHRGVHQSPQTRSAIGRPQAPRFGGRRSAHGRRLFLLLTIIITIIFKTKGQEPQQTKQPRKKQSSSANLCLVWESQFPR